MPVCPERWREPHISSGARGGALSARCRRSFAMAELRGALGLPDSGHAALAWRRSLRDASVAGGGESGAFQELLRPRLLFHTPRFYTRHPTPRASWMSYNALHFACAALGEGG